MLSRIYARITNLRNTLFERGAFKSYALGAPAISVGNITVGGTGKTPMVAFVAGILIEKGEKVCILTRGYGRENPSASVVVSDGERVLANAREAGDEPFELARKLNGKAIIIADANRVAAAKYAKEAFGASVFVLDDAFQHRRARRDLDIVLTDATKPFGNKKTLPFGILREPLENLSRADLIIITRANLVDRQQISDLKFQISNLNPNCPILTAENKISNLIELKDSAEQLAAWNPELETQKAIAFCALGNPQNFFEQLRRENFELAATRAFPDHHRYTQKDVEKLQTEARQTRAGVFLTTVKDAVKLAALKFEIPFFAVETQMIFDDEKKLRELINAALTKNPKP
jgi:tetraacyldisaccharide 4'-kinase